MIHLINVLPVSNVRLFLPLTALFDVELSTQTHIQVFSILQGANEDRVAAKAAKVRHLRHLRHLQKAARAQVVVAQVACGTVLVFLECLTAVALEVLHPVLQGI